MADDKHKHACHQKHLLNYQDVIIYPSDLALLDSSTAWLNDACINFQMTRLQERKKDSRAEKRVKEVKSAAEETVDVGGIDQLDDLFIDPSVISFLMHQLPEDDEDYEDELNNLNASWNLPQPPTSDHNCDELMKLESSQVEEHLSSSSSHSNKSSTTATQKHQRKRVFIPISDQFGASRSTFTRPGGGRHWSLLLWEINTLYYEIDDGYNALVGVGFHHFDSCPGTNTRAAQAVAAKLHATLCAPMSKEEDGVSDVVEVLECKTPQQQNGYDCGVLTLGFAEALSESDGDYGFVKEQHEALVQADFVDKGGHQGFALGLRKRIGDDIRALASQSSTK